MILNNFLKILHIMIFPMLFLMFYNLQNIDAQKDQMQRFKVLAGIDLTASSNFSTVRKSNLSLFED